MTEATKNKSLHFSFGGVENTLGNSMADYMGVFYDAFSEFYTPPISRIGLAKLLSTNGYHSAVVHSRANMISRRFISGGGLRKRQMKAICQNYIQFGDCHLLKIRDRVGRITRLFPLPSMFMRRKKNGDWLLLQQDGKHIIYPANDIIFIAQYDPYQDKYGVPDYLGGVQSALLNNDATMFRRKYFLNGAHMGFIFYATDPNLSAEDEEEMKKTIASSKGVGNFRSMFVNIPNGTEKGIQLIPVGDIATKDEFKAIKEITAQDVLAAHRFPPGLAGIIPANTAGLGDPLKYDVVYQQNEVIPVCDIITDEINSDNEIASNPKIQCQFNVKNNTPDS